MENGKQGSSEKTIIDDFMLAEYTTIASAHFDVHSGLRQNFRFYLGLAAVPFTVFAVYKNVDLTLLRLPSVLLALFAVVPVLGLLMFLTMINTRFDIILYTRAVNGVRAYFSRRAEQLGQSADFEVGRKLPVAKNKPPYNEGINRAYSWLFALISVINSAYAYIVLANLTSWPCLTYGGTGLYLLIHLALYLWLSSVRERREIPGVENT